MITVQPVDSTRLGDLDLLFGSDESADRCWCQWFIRRVRDVHESGRDGNRAAFIDLLASSSDPIGLIAYEAGRPVGWCAAGPRSRYARAVTTPTLRDRDPAEDETVWLVPCFFIEPDRRDQGVASTLLHAAVELAAERGAVAIEGFPLAGDRRRSGGSDLQTGVESLFASAGFEPVTRPSPNRVIMRRNLGSRPTHSLSSVPS